MPPQYEIYPSVSEHMTAGATATQSLLVASAIPRLADPIADPATSGRFCDRAGILGRPSACRLKRASRLENKIAAAMAS